MARRFVQYLSEKQGTILKVVLGLISLLFISILFTAYLIAKRANPILLDENGKPVNTQSAAPHY